MLDAKHRFYLSTSGRSSRHTPGVTSCRSVIWSRVPRNCTCIKTCYRQFFLGCRIRRHGTLKLPLCYPSAWWTELLWAQRTFLAMCSCLRHPPSTYRKVNAGNYLKCTTWVYNIYRLGLFSPPIISVPVPHVWWWVPGCFVEAGCIAGRRYFASARAFLWLCPLCLLLPPWWPLLFRNYGHEYGVGLIPAVIKAVRSSLTRACLDRGVPSWKMNSGPGWRPRSAM